MYGDQVYVLSDDVCVILSNAEQNGQFIPVCCPSPL